MYSNILGYFFLHLSFLCSCGWGWICH